MQVQARRKSRHPLDLGLGHPMIKRVVQDPYILDQCTQRKTLWFGHLSHPPLGEVPPRSIPQAGGIAAATWQLGGACTQSAPLCRCSRRLYATAGTDVEPKRAQAKPGTYNRVNSTRRLRGTLASRVCHSHLKRKSVGVDTGPPESRTGAVDGQPPRARGWTGKRARS